jgi:hypothetical protein
MRSAFVTDGTRVGVVRPLLSGSDAIQLDFIDGRGNNMDHAG